MRLPDELAQAIEVELRNLHPTKLAKLVIQLRDNYRAFKPAQCFNTNDDRLAYLATRMPATYAAITATLKELSFQLPDITLASMLDLGTGPGTALWAATQLYPELTKLTLVDQDRELLALGEKLAATSEPASDRHIAWLWSDISQDRPWPSHDLVTISYALGELDMATQSQLLKNAWQAASQFLIVIEPGTTAGFNNILAARSQILAAGGNLIAPCPHSQACPLAGDWCHFVQRLERSSRHRQAKLGELAYEDEKFSYLIAAKSHISNVSARIVRRPVVKIGHIHLDLCTQQGQYLHQIVAKRERERFKQARKASWGDSWSA